MIAHAGQLREYVYRPHGGANKVFFCKDFEVLLDGPAGTGKSRAIGEYLHYLAETYPGCRIVVIRKTRASLTESWMVTFEQKVLPPGHESINPNKQRGHRTSYNYSNGSHIVLGGMDNATRLFSTEYDVAYVNEATELTEDEWESLHRALRNGVIPYQQLIGDCNPDAEYHWLNRRCIAGRTTRIKSRHEDNPTLTTEYLQRLKENLSGARRERLYYGNWVTAEGAIWPNFDPSTHIIQGELEQNPNSKRWSIHSPSFDHPVEIEWFMAGVDWGFTAPGSMLVFGIDSEKTAYLVHEVYRTQTDAVDWADMAEEVRKKYDIQRFVCDSADPGSISLFNRRMGTAGGYHIAVPVDKNKVGFPASFSMVRERWDKGQRGGLYLLAGSLDSVCPDCRDKKKPTRLSQEIPSYTYREVKDGQPVKEEPTPGGDDHACDALRYAVSFLDFNDWRPAPDEAKYKAGTYGKYLDHEKVKFNNTWRFK